ITWVEIAKRTGRTPHSQMQWHCITGPNKEGFFPNGLIEPCTGRLPKRQAEALAEILRKHTGTPENCCFAIWDGWGFPGLKKLRNRTAQCQLYDRCYYLVRGDISTVVNQGETSPLQTAAVWWPEDRAWCVATEVDMMWTYAAGTEACINEIL